MSDNKDTKKKGFFSRLIQGATDLVSGESAEVKSTEIPTKTQLNKMKKAEIVEAAIDVDLTSQRSDSLCSGGTSHQAAHAAVASK